jgi:hypothetical protein
MKPRMPNVEDAGALETADGGDRLASATSAATGLPDNDPDGFVDGGCSTGAGSPFVALCLMAFVLWRRR